MSKYEINKDWLEASKSKANEFIKDCGSVDAAILHCNTLACMMAYAQDDWNKPTYWDYVKYQLEKIKNN